MGKNLLILGFLTLFSVINAKPLQVWIMPNGASPKEKLETELKTFTKQTGIETEVVVLDWGEAWSRISTALETGKNLPAVLQLGTTWVPYFASKGHLLSLNKIELLKTKPNHFAKESFKSTHIDKDSTVYSLPWFVDVRVLLGNQRVLKECGITEKDIQTYNGFLNALKKIKDKNLMLDDGTPILAYAFPGKSDWNIPHNFAPWIWSEGGDFLKPNKDSYRSGLLDEKTLTGIAKYLNFVLDSLVDRSNLNLNTAQITQKFNNGEVAFILNTAEIIMQTRFASSDGGLQTAKIGNDGVLAFPVPEGSAGAVSFVGGSNLAIPAKFADKEKAIKILKFLTEDKNLDSYTKHIGFLPATQSLLKFWAEDSSYKQLVLSLETGKSYTNIPEWGEIETILTSTFSEIWALLEFEGLYSDAKIYEILKKQDININRVLNFKDGLSNLSYPEFQKIWNKALENSKSQNTQKLSEKKNATTNATERTPFNKFTIGLFIFMLIAGFAFAYSRKKK